MEADFDFEIKEAIEKEALARLEASPLKAFQGSFTNSKLLNSKGGMDEESKLNGLEITSIEIDGDGFKLLPAAGGRVRIPPSLKPNYEESCVCILTSNSYFIDSTCKIHAILKSSL